MCKQMLVVRIDKKTNTEIPEWLCVADIISTTTRRVSGKQVTIYETANGEFQHAVNVDPITQLLSQEEGFVSVDRGVLVNMEYMTGIDAKDKVAILKDGSGEEKRATISGSKMELVKEMFRRYCLPK